MIPLDRKPRFGRQTTYPAMTAAVIILILLTVLVATDPAADKENRPTDRRHFP